MDDKKPFLDLEAQYNLLNSRGMHFDNKELTMQYLRFNNYYLVINGHGHFFRDKNNPGNYLANTNISEIVAIANFDKHFKHILLKGILEIENNFKSVIAYEFSKKYHSGLFEYLNRNNYNQSKNNRITKLFDEINNLITRYLTKVSFDNSIKHYMTSYQNIPLWVLVEHLSFGQLTTMYSLFNQSLRNSIAKEYSRYCINLHPNLPATFRLNPSQIETIFDEIKDVRNLLAHNSMLYWYKGRNNYPANAYLYKNFPVCSHNDRNTIFDTFVYLKLFMSNTQYDNYYKGVKKASKRLDNKLKTITLNDYLCTLGFPKDWIDYA